MPSATLLPPVTMPQLSGGRDRADLLAEPLRGKVRGQVVRLDCRQLVAGTPSFAGQIIKLVLKEWKASRFVIEYASGDFAQYLYDAAKDHGVSDRLELIG